MSKNIVVFSDGTGQRGGVTFDENRTNIYKLFRATRCGPDSSIDPALQLTYYDPGLGTVPEGSGLIGGLFRKIHNIISQATGLGITMNIVDCYAEIIRIFEPGDRIYVFGFSRGAYTVRCLTAVLCFCGVPTQMRDGSPLKRDESSLRKIAKEAVYDVYQHVGSPKDTKYLDQRKAIAARFRNKYGSEVGDGGNANPYFVGVFDTVAAIASYPALAGIAAAVLVLLSLLSWGLATYVETFFAFTWFGILSAFMLAVVGLWYVNDHLKYAKDLEGYSLWDTLHFTSPKMQFYDKQLNPKVGYARHAISIDEHRKDFDRVPWGMAGAEMPLREGGKFLWFKQLWFAGNHADIGGGYSENESRLSDITLRWMLDQAQALPNGLLVDSSVLKIYPSHKGMQHDETRTGIFSHAAKLNRTIIANATLHSSVEDRFKESQVLQYDLMLPYRPEGLKMHEGLLAYYDVKKDNAIV
jgi:uncharacterized protein (DUF2235 family)